ncbi:uncharacterized protein LOC144159849 [Haemaphysalis longicornis]
MRNAEDSCGLTVCNSSHGSCCCETDVRGASATPCSCSDRRFAESWPRLPGLACLVAAVFRSVSHQLAGDLSVKRPAKFCDPHPRRPLRSNKTYLNAHGWSPQQLCVLEPRNTGDNYHQFHKFTVCSLANQECELPNGRRISRDRSGCWSSHLLLLAPCWQHEGFF